MVAFSRLDPRRLRHDVVQIVGDSRNYCTVYRRAPGGSSEAKIARFWARISNIGRQTTGLEQMFVAGNVTGAFWVMRVPPGIVTLQHDDEIRTDGTDDTRWRIVHVRPVIFGQVCILSNIQ